MTLFIIYYLFTYSENRTKVHKIMMILLLDIVIMLWIVLL